MERIYILFLNKETHDDFYDSDGNLREFFTSEWLEENSDILTLATYLLPLGMEQIASIMDLTSAHQEYIFLDEYEYEYLCEFV